MTEAEQRRLALMGVGSPDANAKFRVIPKTVRDTIFVNGGATLEANNPLFTTGSKNRAWNGGELPSNSNAFSIYGINLKPYINFSTIDATDEPSAPLTYTSFLETTYLNFQLGGVEIFNEPISNLVPWFGVQASSPTDEAASWIGNQRRNGDQGFELPYPIVISAGAQFKVTLVVNGTYTAEAVGATNYLYLPNSGLTNSKGHAILCDLRTLQIYDNK